MMKLLLVFVFFLLCVSLSHHLETDENDVSNIRPNMVEHDKLTSHDRHRSKRGIWDIFQKMVITKNLVVDQYTDTRDSLAEVYNLFNGQFSDPAPAKPTGRPASTEAPKTSSEDSTDSSETVKTTTERYRVSRYELGVIFGRNFRGLQRLAKLEFQEALNASHYNLREYKEEANKQFANSLATETKNKIKALTKG